MRVVKFWLVYILLFLASSGASQQLYPYKAGKLFGYCDKDKNMVIPPVYIMTEDNLNFYLCHASRAITHVYNSDARLIDSAGYMVKKMGSNKVLLIDAYNRRDMVEKVIAQQQQNSRRIVDWTDLSPAYGRIIDTLGNKTNLSDTLVALHASNTLVKTRSGKKYGIYNIALQAYSVPMEYDSITLIGRKYYVGWLNGKGEVYWGDNSHFSWSIDARDIKDIYDEGTLLETKAASGGYGTLYNAKGQIVCGPDKQWGRLIYPNMNTLAIWIRSGKNTAQPENLVALYNNRGKFIKNVYTVREWVNDLLLVTEVDKAANGKINHYLYNVTKDKWYKYYSAPRVQDIARVGNDGLFLTIKYDDRREFLNGYTGKSLFTLHDTVWSHKPVKQLMGYLTFTRFIKGAYCDVRYNYVRINLDGPLTLYDPEFNVITTAYDSIQPLRLLNNKFACVKREGKYGLINREMKEVVPAVYDKLEFKNSRYAKVTKAGRTYWIDTANNELFGGVAFDFINDYSVNGLWLAYTYKLAPGYWHRNNYEYTEVAKAHIINAKGEILTTWDAGAEASTAYMLTVNGKILRFPAPNTQATCGVKLYDPQTGKIDSLPHRYRNIETYKGAAIILRCTNTDNETAIFSALDLSCVVPYSNYEEYMGLNVREIEPSPQGREAGITFQVAKKDYESDPESRKTHHTNHLKLTGGFFSVSGIKFWDKESEQ